MRCRLITAVVYVIALLSGDVLAQARPGGNGPLPGDPGYQQPSYPAHGYQPYSYPASPPQDDGLVDSYGAVVFGTKPGQKGGFYWFTGQRGSWEEAHSEALAYCARDGGRTACSRRMRSTDT